MQVDTKAYIFQLFTDLIFFYVFYNLIETHKMSSRTQAINVLITPIILCLNVLFDFSVYGLYIIVIYLVIYRFKFVLPAINRLLFSGISLIFASLVTNALIVPLIDHTIKQGWNYILITQFIKLCILALMILFFKNRINALFEHQAFGYLVVFLQCLMILILYFYIQISHKVGIFNHFTLGTLIFIIIEFLFLSILFVLIYLRTQQYYQDKIEKQQLENLRFYTQQLEQSQIELRKFRHDYKNMLFSAYELAHAGDLKGVEDYLSGLTNYSNRKLTGQTDRYQDIGNIQELHMKSILLNKFLSMEQLNINYHFECQIPVTKFSINPFDMVRLLSITLDNAIEAVQEGTKKDIKMLIYQGQDDLTIRLENSYSGKSESFNRLRKGGVTTKMNHSGLGLSILDDIRHKYQQVFISQNYKDSLFTIQIVIENET